MPPNQTHESFKPANHTAYETASFFWQPQPPPPRKSGYAQAPSAKRTPPPPPAKTAAPSVKTSPPEVKWQISELDPLDQRQIQSLVRMGAKGLSGEVSLSTIKKEYRRLARAYHPDTAPTEEGDRFRELQTIYEKLTRSLKKRLSESACDNGSASAQGSQRQDVA